MRVTIDGYLTELPSTTRKIADPRSGEIVVEQEIPVLPALPDGYTWIECTENHSEFPEYVVGSNKEGFLDEDMPVAPIKII